MDKIPQDYQLNPAAEISKKDDINLSTQKLLAGGETVVGWQESKAEKGERILWINPYTYISADKCRRNMYERNKESRASRF